MMNVDAVNEEIRQLQNTNPMISFETLSQLINGPSPAEEADEVPAEEAAETPAEEVAEVEPAASGFDAPVGAPVAPPAEG